MRHGKIRPFLGAVVLLAAAAVVPAQNARAFSDLLLHLLDIRPGVAVANVGAGDGQFALRLAEEVGPTGRVYANEISPDNIAQIEQTQRERGILRQRWP